MVLKEAGEQVSLLQNFYSLAEVGAHSKNGNLWTQSLNRVPNCMPKNLIFVVHKSASGHLLSLVIWDEVFNRCWKLKRGRLGLVPFAAHNYVEILKKHSIVA